MNWDQFENEMRQSLQDPPSPSPAEVNDSWDKMEPKLFPKKRRGAAWFSLNGLLALLLVGLTATSLWLVGNKKAKKQKVAESVELTNTGIRPALESESDEDNTASIPTDYPTYDPALESESDKIEDESSPNIATHTYPNPSQTNKKKIVKNSTENSQTQVANKSEKNNISSHPAAQTKPTQAVAKSTNSENTESVKIASNNTTIDPTLIASNSSSKMSLPQPAETLADPSQQDNKALLLLNTKNENLKSEVVTEGDMKYLVTTQIIDSGNILSKVYKQALVPPIEVDEDLKSEASADNSTKTTVGILKSIKENLQNDDEVKIKKPSHISIYTAGITGVDANAPTVGGIFGLEWMQELNNKFSIIAGLRYRLSTMKANYADSSVEFYNMTIDTISGPETMVTMYYNTHYKSGKAKSMHIIEIPIYVNYTVVRDFCLQLGLDVSVLMSTQRSLSDEWSRPGSTSSSIPQGATVPGLPSNSAFAINDNDFEGKFGLGLHLGAQYFVTPRLYARFAYNQLLTNYYQGALNDQLGKYSASPNLQLGLGFRLTKKKQQ